MSRSFFWLGLLYAAMPVLACAYDAYEVATTELERHHMAPCDLWLAGKARAQPPNGVGSPVARGFRHSERTSRFSRAALPCLEHGSHHDAELGRPALAF